MQVQEFLENESLATDFTETQQINNMLCEMMYLKFPTQ